jgi:hypothetical protein
MRKRLLQGLALSCLAAGLLAAPRVADAQALYCPSLGSYYPNVTSCPGGWHRVPGYGPGVPGYYAPGMPGYYAPGVPGYYAPGVPGYVPGAPGYVPVPGGPAYEDAPPPGAVYVPPPGYPPPPPGTGYVPPTARPNVPPPARESSEEQAVANSAYRAELGMRREQDAADGFRNFTVEGAIGRYKNLGSVIITGYYARPDKLATLADHDDANSDERIFVVSNKLPRAGQKMLTDCQNCRITIWARKGCSKDALGDQAGAPCLVIERVKKESYEANTPIFR